jgi:hypothetical protein
MNGKLINEAQVLETWSPIIESQTGISDNAKLGWMSKYAHYHSLNEGFTYPQASLLNTPGMGNVAPASTVAGGALNFYGAGSQGSGDKFPSLLPLAIQVAARTVGFDIVPVIPMNGPSGVLTYLDYVYAGGRDVNAPGIAGQGNPLTNNANFTDKFLVFKVARNSVTTAIYNAVAASAIGTYYVFTADAVDTDVKGLLVAWVGKSRIDGGLIFRVVGESADVSAVTAGVVDYSNIPSNATQGITFADVIVAGADSAIYTAASATLAGNTWTTGTLSLTGGSAAGDVDGVVELVRALEDHVQGFAGSGPNDNAAFSGNSVNALSAYEPMRRGVGETTQYRTMGMQAFTKFVEAETFQVAATVTTEQIQDLNRQYGIDVLSMMENALVNDISQSINKHILFRAFALGWQNHYNVNNVEGTNFNVQLDPATSPAVTAALGLGNEETAPASGIYSTLSIPISTFPIYGGTTSAFENQGTIQRRIQSKVLAAANMVAQRGRRGPANFAVTNLQIATALQDSAQFTFYPLANTINQNNGALYPIGTLAGLTIYVDPNMNYNDTRVCVGRKGADEEPGLKFMPYLMAESIQTIAEGTMAPKIAVKSRYALVEAGFHPETQYLTFVVNTFTDTTTGANWNSGTLPINIA